MAILSTKNVTKRNRNKRTPTLLVGASTGGFSAGGSSSLNLLALANIWAEINTFEKVIISSTDGEELLKIVDSGASSATTANPYMSFYYGSTPVRTGYIGLDSLSNPDMYIVSQHGNIVIAPLLATHLRYSSAVKLATTNTGVEITGNLEATGEITAYAT